MVKTVLERLNALILLCMFCVTVLTVVFRTVLQMPASWSEDLAQLTFILLVFLGAATVMEDESHIQISTVVDLFGERGRRVVRVFSRALTLPFLVLFIIGAWDNALVNWDVELGTVEWIRIGHMYLALALTASLMTFYTLLNMVRDFKGTYRPPTGLNSTV